MEEERQNVLQRVESLFDRKFFRVFGLIIGAFPIMYGGVTYLQGTGLKGNTISFITMVGGVIVVLVTYALTRRSVK